VIYGVVSQSRNFHELNVETKKPEWVYNQWTRCNQRFIQNSPRAC